MLPSVHDDRARVSFINDKQTFCYTNNTVSDYFHLKTGLLLETKSGKALASLVTPSPTPLKYEPKVGIKLLSTHARIFSNLLCQNLFPYFITFCGNKRSIPTHFLILNFTFYFL